MINNQFAVSGQQDTASTPDIATNVRRDPADRVSWPSGLLAGVAADAVRRDRVRRVVPPSGRSAGRAAPFNYRDGACAPLIIYDPGGGERCACFGAVRQTMVETPDRKEWARRALEHHMGEIAVACITTAIGFMALNFSISPPFRELGNVVAVGVIAALFFTLFLLPSLICLIPMKRRTEPASTDRLMRPLAEFVIGWRKPLLIGGSLIVLGLGQRHPAPWRWKTISSGISTSATSFVRTAIFYENRLGGLNALEWALPAGEENGINNPDYLKKVGAFVAFLREEPNVRYVRSMTDTIARLNMNMHADDLAYHRLPDGADEAAQFLFLFELSLGYGMDLTDQINVDRSALRITATMPNVTTTQMHAVTRKARDWLNENAPSLQVEPTGMTHVFNQISYRDVRAMLSGTVLALVAISALILLILRDVKLGIISLIPNLIPAGMAFGIWGYSVGSVTLAIAVVIAMTLGIVVDDTVHFLSKYNEGKRRGMSAEDAVRHAFDKVGMALVVTTIGLVIGFAILAQSGFAVNGDMAKLTAITISVALVADLFLLPAILIALDRGVEPMTARTATAAALALVAGLAPSCPTRRRRTPPRRVLPSRKKPTAVDNGWGDFPQAMAR